MTTLADCPIDELVRVPAPEPAIPVRPLREIPFRANAWLPDELDRLQQLFAGDTPLRDIARLLGRPLHGVRSRLHELGLRRNSSQPWTELDDAELSRRYGLDPTAAIAADLGRSCSAIYARAALLGLTESNPPPWTPWEDAQLAEAYPSAADRPDRRPHRPPAIGHRRPRQHARPAPPQATGGLVGPRTQACARAGRDRHPLPSHCRPADAGRISGPLRHCHSCQAARAWLLAGLGPPLGARRGRAARSRLRLRRKPDPAHHTPRPNQELDALARRLPGPARNAQPAQRLPGRTRLERGRPRLPARPVRQDADTRTRQGARPLKGRGVHARQCARARARPHRRLDQRRSRGPGARLRARHRDRRSRPSTRPQAMLGLEIRDQPRLRLRSTAAAAATSDQERDPGSREQRKGGGRQTSHQRGGVRCSPRSSPPSAPRRSPA